MVRSLVTTAGTACAAWALSSDVARADPVSGVIGLTALIEVIIGGASITVLGATITAGAIGGAILGAAALAGGAYLLRNQLDKPSLSSSYGSTGVNSPSVRFSERQSIPNKRILFGYGLVGGALFFEEVSAPYLVMGLLYCDDQIDGIERIQIGSNALSFASISENAILTPLSITGQPAYSTHVRCSFGFGADDQARDALAYARFPALSSTFRQRGVARGVFEFSYGAGSTEYTALWGQSSRPNPLVIARGVRAFDPRDPTQDVDDPSTHTFTQTPALLIAHYMTRNYGGRATSQQIVWDSFSAAANWHEGRVGTASGDTIQRYTIDGLVSLAQRPSDILQDMLWACRSHIIDRGGMIYLSSSAPKTPIATITDQFLTGGFDFRAQKPRRETYNQAKFRFVSEDNEYQVVEGPIIDRADWQAADGEVLTLTRDYSFILDYRRAQRVARADLYEARLGRSLTCRLDIAFLAHCADELVGGAVTMQSDLFSQANGTYICSRLTLLPEQATIEVDLVEYDSSIETSYDPAVDELSFTVPDVGV